MKQIISIVFLTFSVFLSNAQVQYRQFKKEIKQEISINYALQLPDNYDKIEKEWPLILFLHGSGERGDDLEKVAIHGPLKYVREGHKIDAIIVAPQCPDNQYWGDVDFIVPLISDLEENYAIDTTRIYITGLSMGGYGTWFYSLKHSEIFAAIAPVCGPTFRTFPRNANVIKDKPIWIFHGAKDDVVDVSESEAMYEALKNAGGNPKLTIYPEANHDSWTETFNNPLFYEWLLSKTLKNEN